MAVYRGNPLADHFSHATEVVAIFGVLVDTIRNCDFHLQ
jgi:hypothetical protein